MSILWSARSWFLALGSKGGLVDKATMIEELNRDEMAGVWR